MIVLIPTALISGLLLSMAPSTVFAKPKKMGLKSCGKNGNPRKCSVDMGDFNANTPDGDDVEIDFGEGLGFDCISKGTAHGAAWHANCRKKEKGGGHSKDGVRKKEKGSGHSKDGVEGAMNVLSRGKNSRGEDCMHGSLSAGGEVCIFGPDATCDEIIVECKPESEAPEDAEPLVPPKEEHVHPNTEELPSSESGAPFKKLATQKRFLTVGKNLRRSRRGLNSEDLGDNLDVLVAWTKAAECQNSGLPVGCTVTDQTMENMQGHIDLAVEETNIAFDNSGIETQLRLAHAYREGLYTEANGDGVTDYDTFDIALNDITNNRGLEIDVRKKRDDHGADLVVLIVHDEGTICGLAWNPGMPREDLMYSVTKWSCATGYYSFGHEIAHNLGCNHDRGTVRACGAGGYNYGYRDPNANFRTILAYRCRPGQCDNNPGEGCQRIQYFSNPFTTTENGLPVGDASHDNARHINSVKAEVAAFRAFVPQCSADDDCDDSDLCTTNVCDGVCIFEPIDCDDSNACTTDSCEAGSCIHSPMSCDDGNSCTNDSCDAVLGCSHAIIPGCCGNDICEEGEDMDSCLQDCAAGPFEIATPLCTSCVLFGGGGNMFDVEVAVTDITVTSIKTRVYTGAVAEVWTKPGSHIGYERNSAAWTKVAEHDLSLQSRGSMAVIPATSFTQTVAISAGSRQAFYVTMQPGGSLLFGDPSEPSTSTPVAEDDHVRIYQGPAKAYLFGPFMPSPKIWNGEIVYYKAECHCSWTGCTRGSCQDVFGDELPHEHDRETCYWSFSRNEYCCSCPAILVAGANSESPNDSSVIVGVETDLE